VRDPNLKVAFYFALKDTLVADTLDQATRIAYPKVKRLLYIIVIPWNSMLFTDFII